MDRLTELHILNILRQGTLSWSGRNNALNRNRRLKRIGTFKNGSPHEIWVKDCEVCNKEFEQRKNLLQVDHIDPVGPFNGDFDDYVRRMFCDEENLQAICDLCHDKKTAIDVASMRATRKKKFIEDSPLEDELEYLL